VGNRYNNKRGQVERPKKCKQSYPDVPPPPSVICESRLPNFVGNAGGGDKNWQNPTNAKLLDNVFATVPELDNHKESRILLMKDFGFAIPLTNIILEIILEHTGKTETNGNGHCSVWQPSKINDQGEAGRENATHTAFTTVSTTYVDDASPLWGVTWTPAQINSNVFSILLSVDSTINNETISIDQHKVTVCHRAP